MKNLKVIVLALCASFMLASCGGGSPEAVAENMYKAFFNADFDKAASYATAQSAAGLKQMASMSADEKNNFKEMMKDAKVKAVGHELNEAGDVATVNLEITGGPEGKTDTVSCRVVKEDGSWKAEFKK